MQEQAYNEQAVNQNFLMFIAEVSEIMPEDLEKLFYNGFDNPESLELCSPEDLQQLGVSDPAAIHQRLQDTLQAYREVQPPVESYDLANEQLQNDQIQEEEVDETPEEIVLPKDARNLSREILLGAQLKKPVVTHRQWLEAMTHLKMTKMGLSSLTSTDMEGQENPLLVVHCPNLQILYLQENYLTTMGPSAFSGLKQLRQITLFNNYIAKIDFLDECVNLQKLYLEGNRITRLEGLNNCTALMELYLGN